MDFTDGELNEILKNITTEDLITLYKNIDDFIKYLETQIIKEENGESNG